MSSWISHQQRIESAFSELSSAKTVTLSPALSMTVQETLQALNEGRLRIANQEAQGRWCVNEWVKKAILLYFRLQPNALLREGVSVYYDKIPLKFTDYTSEQFQQESLRVVPNATVRFGAYLAPHCVLLPCFVNIGAYVDRNTMIDTWSTVGSCAQIGKNVHLSGGVGIGGVLEPLQSHPTIIEDDCFIGARSEIVEGVIVEEGAVVSMGVFISQSTPIYDRERREISYGRVPAGAVVIPGSLPGKDGDYHRSAAIIIKRVDSKTRQKVAINELLRT